MKYCIMWHFIWIFSVCKRYPFRSFAIYDGLINVYAVGTQKNHLLEMVLLGNPQHMFVLYNKKIIKLLHYHFFYLECIRGEF